MSAPKSLRGPKKLSGPKKIRGTKKSGSNSLSLRGTGNPDINVFGNTSLRYNLKHRPNKGEELQDRKRRGGYGVPEKTAADKQRARDLNRPGVAPVAEEVADDYHSRVEKLRRTS